MTKQEKVVFGSFALLVLVLMVVNMIKDKSLFDFCYLVMVGYGIIKIKKLA